MCVKCATRVENMSRTETSVNITMQQHLFTGTLIAGDPAGHHVIIVDDLVMTGGTLVQCAKVRIFLELVMCHSNNFKEYTSLSYTMPVL